MKLKLLIFLPLLLLLTFCLPIKNANALEVWALAKYAPTWDISSKTTPSTVAGPVGVTLGISPISLIAIDVTLAGRVAMQGNKYLGNYFDLKPYILLQTSVGGSWLSFKPYFGVGPAFYFGTSEYASGNSIGAAVKLGLRMQFAKYIMVGIGGEYFYHKNSFSPHNFSLIIEAGAIF